MFKKHFVSFSRSLWTQNKSKDIISLLSLPPFYCTTGRTFSSSVCFHGQQKIQLKTHAINYEQVGTGPHKIVCLPGTLGFIESDFAPQLKNLDKEKFTIVVWDPPGYGKSRPPARDYSGNFFKKDALVVAELMEALNHQQYSVLGWSGGGITAIQLAAEFPNNVNNLVVWGAHAFMNDDTLNNSQLADVDQWSEQMRAPLEKVYGNSYLKEIWNGWAQACRAFRDAGGDMGHKTILKNIKCPTLVINGDSDPIAKPYHAEYLHKHIPGSKLVIWPKGKHNIHLRFPDEFNSLVQNFLLENSRIHRIEKMN